MKCRKTRLPAGERDHSHLRKVQTGSESHPNSYFNGYYRFSLKIERSVCEADNPTPSGVHVKNKWSCTSTSHVNLHGVHSNFIFISCPRNYFSIQYGQGIWAYRTFIFGIVFFLEPNRSFMSSFILFLSSPTKLRTSASSAADAFVSESNPIHGSS